MAAIPWLTASLGCRAARLGADDERSECDTHHAPQLPLASPQSIADLGHLRLPVGTIGFDARSTVEVLVMIRRVAIVVGLLAAAPALTATTAEQDLSARAMSPLRAPQATPIRSCR
jgi:hypothetical protein